MQKDLTLLLNPRSIAIIGASADLSTISGQPFRHLTAQGYPGHIYPVNPRYRDIGGTPCYPTLADVPEVPDLALILINASRVEDMLRQCGEKGVRFVIIFSSGFSETGGDGAKLQGRISALGREYDMGIVGPNCQGMINVAGKVFAGFGSVFTHEYVPGGVSMVTQSGGFGYSVMNLSANEGGLPFRQIVTTGNESGLTTLDFLAHFVEEPETTLIAAYTEGLKDARRLMEVAARAMDAGKPILMWKVGNTEQGQRAAASHTANLGGAMALYRAAFRQAGIIQIEDIQDLIDYGHALGCGRLPRGNRVAIITISGGAGILMTDECIARGMVLPELAPETTERLRSCVPAFGSLRNPVDVTASIFNDTDLLRNALEAVIDDPNVDSVAVLFASLQGELAAKVAREMAIIAKSRTKPLFSACSARDAYAAEAYAIFREARIPNYKSPVRCGRAMAALSQYAEAKRAHDARKTQTPLVMHSAAASDMLAAAPPVLSEYAAKKVLAAYGIPVTGGRLAHSAAEARAIAADIGYPVAVKSESADIPHKTEAGAVIIGVASDHALDDAYVRVVANAAAFRPDAVIDGVLVQEMVSGGTEVILGVTNDPLFGPAVMFGLGGIFAEVLEDVSFRLAPVTAEAAQEMIGEIRGYPLLTGARGRPPADIDAIVDAIVKLSALAVDLADEVAEVDINPLFVMPAGGGVKAADALIKKRNG